MLEKVTLRCFAHALLVLPEKRSGRPSYVMKKRNILVALDEDQFQNAFKFLKDCLKQRRIDQQEFLNLERGRLAQLEKEDKVKFT